MNIIQEAKDNVKAKKMKAKKENTNMKASKIETLKTIALTALIAGIIAFGLGVWYESHRTAQVKTEAAAIAKEMKAEATAAHASKQ